MNVFTVVVTGSIVCSLAYAAHQGRPVSAQPEGAALHSVNHEGLVLGQRPKGHTMAALGGGGGSCTVGEPLNWFTQVHVLPACVGFAVNWRYEERTARDVDGDGVLDYLMPVSRISSDQACDPSQLDCVTLDGMSYRGAYDWMPDTSGHLAPGDGMFRYSLTVVNGTATASYQSVVSTSVLQAALCAVAQCDGSGSQVNVRPADFQDVDLDGDLDLLLDISWVDLNGWQGRGVWIENTVKANPPLAADINQDGVVDGKDLAAVLAGWTP